MAGSRPQASPGIHLSAPQRVLGTDEQGDGKGVQCLTQPHRTRSNKEDVLGLLELGTPFPHEAVQVIPRGGKIKRSRPM